MCTLAAFAHTCRPPTKACTVAHYSRISGIWKFHRQFVSWPLICARYLLKRARLSLS